MNPFIGIVLALACALAGNVGFVYKQRGARAAPAVDMRRPLLTARSLFGSPLFAIGMLIAVAAWIFHVAAMAVAPLSLVQAVLAGGVVLLAVMAERVFGVRVEGRQWIGLGLAATGLMLLGVTVPGAHGGQARFSASHMIAFEACLIAAGTLLIMGTADRRAGAATRVHARRCNGNSVRGFRCRHQGHLHDLGLGGSAGAAQPVDGRHARSLDSRLLRLRQSAARR